MFSSQIVCLLLCQSSKKSIVRMIQPYDFLGDNPTFVLLPYPKDDLIWPFGVAFDKAVINNLAGRDEAKPPAQRLKQEHLSVPDSSFSALFRFCCRS